MKYIASITIIFLSLTATAQEFEKRKKDFVPSSLYLSTDMIGLVNTISSKETSLEFHSKIDFDSYFLSIDYGYSKFDMSSTDFNYSSKGSFYRFGPQVNFMPFNPHRSMITFGISYAFARFEDRANFVQPGQNWNDAQLILANDKLKSNWYEMNLGLMVKLFGPIHLGYMARFQFGQSISGHDGLFPFEIPGFGDASKGSNFRFNYFITYRLGFRKKPIPKRPKKIIEISTGEENSNPPN